jgi:hypothetical protein
VAGGEDVAALIAFLGVHECIPLFWYQSIQKKRPESGLPVSGRLNGEGPVGGRAFSVSSSILRNGRKLMGRFLYGCKWLVGSGLWFFW